MKLEFDKLLTQGMRIDAADNLGNTKVIQVDSAADVRGTVETQSGRIALRGLASSRLALSSIEWCLSEETTLEVGGLVASGLAVDAELETNGSSRRLQRAGASAAELVADLLRLDHVGQRVEGELRVEGVAVEQGEGRIAQVTASRIALTNASARKGRWELRAASVVAEEAHLVGANVIEAARVTVEGARVSDGNLTVEVDRIELPRGIRIEGGQLTIGEIAVGTASLAVGDVVELFRRPADGPRVPERPPFDWRFLDALHGQLDVDLELDATVPVIGRRASTHHFRVPIRDGAINYKQLERDLATLEDAVIDIKVRGDRLVLERGIPIVNFFNKPLLFWYLRDEDLELAKRKLVRLRRLFDWGLPRREPADEPSGDAPRFVLRRLAFGNTRIELSLGRSEIALPAVATIELGGEQTLAVGRLEVLGNVVYHRSEPPEETRVEGRAEDLNAGVPRWTVGGVAVTAASLHADALADVTLQFDGLRPRALAGKLTGLRVAGVVTRRVT